VTGSADRRGQDGDGYGQQAWQPQQPVYDQYGQQQGYAQEPYPQEQQYQEYYQQPGYDPYAQQQQAYVQDPYQGYQQQYPPQQEYQPQQPGYDPYGQQQAYVQDPYGTGQHPVVQPVAQPVAPVQPVPPARPVRPVVPPRPRPAEPVAPVRPEEPSEQVGGRRTPKAPAEDYQTGEFTFVDEEAEETEDVIDWLKFAESRSERRDERRRKLRNRAIGLVVVLALAAGGGAGYLWWTGKLGSAPTAAKAAGPRQVNVVHLRDLQGKVSTALLVDDESGQKGSVLLLPETLKLPSTGDTATVALGQAMDSIGPSSTRDGLNTVLGATVAGTWRLDTPYLQLLVAQLGGIKVDTNAEVHDAAGKSLAPAGKAITLNGQAAVAYATYQATGEGRDAQLARFGQVLDAVVRTMPTDLAEAQDDVHRMNAVLDPSLPEQALAGVLAQLAKQAKNGHFSTGTLKVKQDGTLDEATAGQQVKEVLGGTVHSAQGGSSATVRVSILNASGNEGAANSAVVQVTNSGQDVVPSSDKPGSTQATSEIRYTDDSKLAAAKSLATSLNLKETAVKKVTGSQNADLVVVLGKDYQVPKQQ